MFSESFVYFECPVKSNHRGTVEVFEWHPLHPIIAVSLSKATENNEVTSDCGGVVNVFDQSGFPIPGAEVKNDVASSDVISWHPSKRFLAIGWMNGAIALRSEEGNCNTQRIENQHLTAISFLVWADCASSSSNCRLISTDKNGQLIIWKCDPRGKFPATAMSQCNMRDVGFVTTAVMRRVEPLIQDMATLAKAAAEGDERALELLVSGRAKSQKSVSADGISCFIGCENGQLFHIDEKGSYIVHFDSRSYGAGGIKKVMLSPKQDVLVAVTNSLTIYAFAIESDLSLKEIGSVRLSSRNTSADFTWAGDSAIAIATGESGVRMFSTSTFDNFVLNLPEVSNNASSLFDPNASANSSEIFSARDSANDVVLSVHYSAQTNLLVAGCKSGRLHFWRYQPGTGGAQVDLDTEWAHDKTLDPVDNSSGNNATSSSTKTNVKRISWCNQHVFLGTQSSCGITIYEQTQTASSYHSELTCVQLTATDLSVQSFKQGLSAKVTSTLQVRGITISQPIVNSEYESQSLVVWDGENACVYDVNSQTNDVAKNSEFPCTSPFMSLYEQSIYTLEPTKLQVRNLQGVVKQMISLPSSDKIASACCMNVNGSSLVLATANGHVLLFNLSKREAKMDRPARNMKELIPKLVCIKSCKVNSNGRLVSMIIQDENVDPSVNVSSCLYVWDAESDTVIFHDFLNERGSSASRRMFGGTGGGGDATTINASTVLPVDDDDGASQDSNDALLASNHDVKKELRETSVLKIPLAHYWSSDDPRILTCEVRRVQIKNATSKLGLKVTLDNIQNEGSSAGASNSLSISVFFVDIPTAPLLMLKESFPMPSNCSKLVGFDVPFYYCIANPLPRSGSAVVRVPMREFTGFSNCDNTTKRAMIDFSFHIAYANMDEAFRAIKLIKNEAVWENMCRMCVKNQNLSVAKMCLGNMRNLRATHALRKAEAADMEIPAQTAMLAIALGLRDEAEKLLKSCGRYDLLNEIHQAQGEWDEAINVAEKHDRIHLSTTQYNYARFLEQHNSSAVTQAAFSNNKRSSLISSQIAQREQEREENLDKAMKLFEKANTHHFDVPRILSEDYGKLLEYINNKSDLTLYKWWAQYCESTQNIDLALQYYGKANDVVSRVRVLCFLNRFEEAMELCNTESNYEDDMGPGGDASDSANAVKAGCYFLAQQFESLYISEMNERNLQHAVTYFMRAEAYSNACKLCKEAHDYEQLKNVASLGSLNDKLDAAKFLEAQDTRDCRDKALQLYSMAGQGLKVAELTRGEQKAVVMDSIVAHLDESSSSPEQLREFAKFFKDTGLYEKAISLYIQAKDYDAALSLLEEAASVNITDEMAEKLCPDKSDKSIDTRQRNELLIRLAYICQAQQKYTLAYKKFQQAGDINQGFKALLKSGEVELIFKTAKVSRKPDLMIDAANYFKTLQWVQAEDVVIKIIELYQKAKAFDLLALFYISCAELEMDQYQAYDKTIDALKEAEKELGKALPTSKDPVRIESALTQIKHRIKLIATFLENDSLTTDKEAVTRMNDALKNILEDANYQRFPRERDIYTRMLANFLATEQNQKAFQCLETLHSLEGGIRGLRRLFSGGADSAANEEETAIRKVNMLVEKVCERVDKSDLAYKFKIGTSLATNHVGGTGNADDDDGVDDESGDEKELQEDIDD